MRIPTPGKAVSPLGADHAPMRARISLTPLIDVVFILLVFFMLASSFLDWRAFDLSVGAPGSSAAPDDGTRLHIQVRADGSWRLNGEPVSVGDLQARVRERLDRDPQPGIRVEPQAGVPLQATIDVLDALRAAGAEQVSLVNAAGAQ